MTTKTEQQHQMTNAVNHETLSLQDKHKKKGLQITKSQRKYSET